jgi:hypothetical protein
MMLQHRALIWQWEWVHTASRPSADFRVTTTRYEIQFLMEQRVRRSSFVGTIPPTFSG